MNSMKVLYVNQEITPYLRETEMSRIGRYLPQGIQEKGREIRTFMPKYGCINERRNQLHEVIRLSGMNLIIDDTDHPLIIKVASIQAARMQVYFIDNEEYFQRKYKLKDAKGRYFPDNDERAIFFARGVLETVRKLRWSPDLVHCHGWFTSLVPLYLKKVYADDPLYSDAKVILSVYKDDFAGSLDEGIPQKVLQEGISRADIRSLKNPTYENLMKLAIDHSDAIISGSKDINKNLEEYIKKSAHPVLEYTGENEYIDRYSEFYDEILTQTADIQDE